MRPMPRAGDSRRDRDWLPSGEIDAEDGALPLIGAEGRPGDIEGAVRTEVHGDGERKPRDDRRCGVRIGHAHDAASSGGNGSWVVTVPSGHFQGVQRPVGSQSERGNQRQTGPDIGDSSIRCDLHNPGRALSVWGRGKVGNVGATVRGGRNPGRDRVTLGKVRHARDGSVQTDAENLVTVALGDPERVPHGQHRVRLTIRVVVARFLGDRVLTDEGADVGNKFGTACAVEAVESVGRLTPVRIATGEQRVELAIEIGDVGDPGDRAEDDAVGRQPARDEYRTAFFGADDPGMRSLTPRERHDKGPIRGENEASGVCKPGRDDGDSPIGFRSRHLSENGILSDGRRRSTCRLRNGQDSYPAGEDDPGDERREEHPVAACHGVPFAATAKARRADALFPR